MASLYAALNRRLFGTDGTSGSGTGLNAGFVVFDTMRILYALDSSF